jgi:nucleolar complex protein 2
VFLSRVNRPRTDVGRAHKLELDKLAAKDPEFFKYLQENDQELLDFDLDVESEVEEEDDIEPAAKGQRSPELTKEELNRWQKSLLEVLVCLLGFNSY